MNLKKYYKYVPFIIFFVVLLIWHWKIPLMADDLTFKGIISRHPLFPLNGNSYLEYRYSSWSSRTLIEFNLGILLSLPGKIWKLLDSIVFVLIPFLITKISIDSEKLSNKKSIFLQHNRMFICWNIYNSILPHFLKLLDGLLLQ